MALIGFEGRIRHEVDKVDYLLFPPDWTRSFYKIGKNCFNEPVACVENGERRRPLQGRDSPALTQSEKSWQKNKNGLESKL